MPAQTNSIKNYLSLVKFSHTIFALPFALIGFFMAVFQAKYDFEWITFIYVILCMVFARSAAMAFNRYIDRDIDTANPRTAEIREIPNGSIKAKSALIFVVVNALLLVLIAWLINPLCFYLSPIVLAVILGYSYTKRFTALCHLILGMGLGMTPAAAYIAVSAEFDMIPFLFSGIVLFWVSGFDIIYALQDQEFDKEHKLNSIPVLLGKKNALLTSRFLHLVSASFVLLAGYLGDFHAIYWLAAAIFIGLLVFQHTLVKHDNLSRVNLAFFTTNGVASVIFGALVVLSMYL